MMISDKILICLVAFILGWCIPKTEQVDAETVSRHYFAAEKKVAKKSAVKAFALKAKSPTPTLEEILASLTPPDEKTTFVLPVVGRVTSNFGWRGRRFHPGIDISVPMGTLIRSAAKGYVEDAGWMSGYGYFIDVRHSERMITRYAHLSKILVQKGKNLRASDPIALSGATGHVTGPHLHFEVRVDSKPYHPEKIITQLALSDGFHRG